MFNKNTSIEKIPQPVSISFKAKATGMLVWFIFSQYYLICIGWLFLCTASFQENNHTIEVLKPFSTKRF